MYTDRGVHRQGVAQLNLDNSIRYKKTNELSASGLIVCNQQWPISVTVDGDRVYWINRDIRASEGRIMSLERSGGVPRILLDQRDRLGQASLVGNRTDLYWIERETMIMRMAK
jgi:hypothetical protein